MGSSTTSADGEREQLQPGMMRALRGERWRAGGQASLRQRSARALQTRQSSACLYSKRPGRMRPGLYLRPKLAPASQMPDGFENRSGAYILVREHRKRRNAGR